MQPGTEAAFAPETVEFLPGTHKSLLQQVFRQGGVAAGQSPQQAVDMRSR